MKTKIYDLRQRDNDNKRNMTVLACACVVACATLVTPIHAEGLDGLIDSIITKIQPFFAALCRLSWFVAAICIVIAFFQFMLGGAAGDRNSVAWLKNIVIAVVCINIVGGVLTFIQGEVTSGDLGNDLSNLGNYSGN